MVNWMLSLISSVQPLMYSIRIKVLSPHSRVFKLFLSSLGQIMEWLGGILHETF